jgi:hypothetical protein
MDSVIYQDNTNKDIWLKLILAIPLLVILGTAFYSLAANDIKTAVEMLGTVVLILIIFWTIKPRRYIIFDSKVKIVLGGPFSLNISFKNIKTARIPRGITFGINFPSSLSSKHAVEIVRKNGMTINITPDNRELFIESLEKAMSNWKQYNSRGTV